MTRQNIVFFVSLQLPLAGTLPAMVLTLVLNRPLIRSIEIGTGPLFKDPSCKNEISVGVTTTWLARDPFPETLPAHTRPRAASAGERGSGVWQRPVGANDPTAAIHRSRC